ncbi:hypothetical protein KXD93_26170 [Mucilaginibacter sp. BJC16-A38]|uniref:hypothetical protein n=1 Tax=Mucilaginibacter phenanthrenivorans TaxID=1234842 RepID=UPI0021580805|nr:hypothetical protein [Mucilaginibacter phenanthrenivorans]MCR8561172.1 hypothetical protein [Mucilaginibacter phenanthrenivorans]
MMEDANDELFKVDKLAHTDGLIKAELFINPNSAIFKGHFPGQPIVPGACMLQIAKEVIESALGQSLTIQKAGNLKFIGMIDPLVTSSVQLEIAYKFVEDEVSFTGKLSDGDRVCFKLQARSVAIKTI